MAYDDPGLLHLDAMLTQISVGYTNNAFVSEVLFPSVTVQKQSDRYFVFPKDRFDIIDDLWAPRSQANEVPPLTLSRETYFAQEHGLVDIVTPQEIKTADSPLDPLQRATERVMESILLNREDAAATLATTVANYDTNHSTTLSGTSQWNDYTNSDPIGDIKTGRDQIHSAIFREPNVLILGYEVASQLEDHPDFIERIKYSQFGVTTDQIIARVLGVDRVVRAGAVKNTANLGATVTTSYIWGKDAVLAYVPPNPGMDTPAYGYEFTWTYAEAGQGITSPTERWWDNDLSAWKVRARRAYDHKFAAIDNTTDKDSIAGYLIKSAVA